MRLYRLESKRPLDLKEWAESIEWEYSTTWHPSNAAAKSAKAKLVSEGNPRKNHTITLYDIPTDVKGLINWLNNPQPI